MIAPCKGCDERVVGCHAQCLKYKQFDDFRKTVRDKKQDYFDRKQASTKKMERFTQYMQKRGRK